MQSKHGGSFLISHAYDRCFGSILSCDSDTPRNITILSSSSSSSSFIFFTEKSTRNFSFSQVLKTAELQVAGNLGQAAVVAVVAFRARCLGPGGQTSGLIPTSAAPRTRRDFALLGFSRKVAGLS